MNDLQKLNFFNEYKKTINKSIKKIILTIINNEKKINNKN